MNKLVSVVVPIYNVELYLEDCIKSIINQSYKNLEIILVDDGSTDNSPKICDNFVKLDDRIKVIHKSNGGLSDARNCGLENSSGYYICFIDSDDFVHYQYIEKLYNSCVENNADISACFYEKKYEISDSNLNEELLNSKYKNIDGRNLIIGIYKGNEKNVDFVVWNKLYKKSLFIDSNIRYPIGRYYEDDFTTFHLLYNSKIVTLVRDTLYYYRLRSGSIMKSNMNMKKIKDYIDADLCPISFYQNFNDYELLSLSLKCLYNDIIVLYYKIKKENKNEYSNIQYILSKYVEYWQLFNKYLKTKFLKKLKYLTYYYYFKMICSLNR